MSSPSSPTSIGPPVHAVRVEPAGVTIEVEEGEPLMWAAERVGYTWPTLCHGNAECTVCWIEVTDTAAFDAPTSLEERGLRLFEGRTFFEDKNVRLACQARPVCDTVVTKRGVKPLMPTDSGREPGGGGAGLPPAPD